MPRTTFASIIGILWPRKAQACVHRAALIGKPRGSTNLDLEHPSRRKPLSRACSSLENLLRQDAFQGPREACSYSFWLCQTPGGAGRLQRMVGDRCLSVHHPAVGVNRCRSRQGARRPTIMCGQAAAFCLRRRPIAASPPRPVASSGRVAGSGTTLALPITSVTRSLGSKYVYTPGVMPRLAKVAPA